MDEITTRTFFNNDSFVIVMDSHSGVFTSPLWSLESWYGSWNGYAWDTQCSLDFGGDYLNLFTGNERSGTGTIKNSGRRLEITIESPPAMFQINAGGILKTYYLGQEALRKFYTPAFVWCDGINHGYGGSSGYDYTPISGLLLLREDATWGLNKSVTGKVLSNGSVVGYITGVEFGSIISNAFFSMGGNCSAVSDHARYIKGGYFFGQCLWINEVVGQVEIVVDVGTEVIKTQAEWDGSKFIIDSLPIYNIDYSTTKLVNVEQLSTSRRR